MSRTRERRCFTPLRAAVLVGQQTERTARLEEFGASSSGHFRCEVRP